MVQPYTLISLLREFMGRYAKLGAYPIQYNARASSAFIVHAWNLKFSIVLWVLLEDYDLGVLTAELND